MRIGKKSEIKKKKRKKTMRYPFMLVKYCVLASYTQIKNTSVDINWIFTQDVGYIKAQKVES